MSLSPGTRLGRYRIQSPLGAGGMAEVYLAEDTALGRRVALKLLPPDATADEHARKRFLREARAAASLDHPNICAVYDVGEDAGHRFIAMQYLEGETLDARLRRRPLELRETLALAVGVADALTEAHARGIVHRDIKPSNIMITPRGDAVVLDFGLAKLARDDEAVLGDAVTKSVLSAPGVVMGTVPYMSPEQVRGDALDGRTDIFSFGVTLYEMLTGVRPFGGRNPASTASAILTEDPPPLSARASDVPEELARIVGKALKKAANERYQTANDLLVDLRAVRNEQDLQTRSRASALHSPAGERARGRRGGRWAVVAAAVVVLAAAAGWYFWRQAEIRRAESRLQDVEALTDSGRFFEAYDLAVDVERVLPGDATLTRLMSVLAMTLTVTTEPAGASVYLKRFAPDPSGALPDREFVGTTPLTDLRVARGEYVLRIEKDGYAPAEQTLSGAILRSGTFALTPPPLAVSVRLVPGDEMPAGMVAVPGGDYRLVAWSRPTDRRIRLGDFFIDKYEVSNREYKEFISAGGYLRRELWQHPFVRDGRTLSWEDAMKLLVDRSGLPGPRSWSRQNIPDGKGDHPVTDITWYEAAAYAAYRGKTLPTVFQWEKAARMPPPVAIVASMPWGVFYPGDTLAHRANFDGAGTVPISALEFGMSPYGAYNMAGNVAEWTASDTSEGRIATGGAWGEPTYVFAQFRLLPDFFSSGKVGFRCALNAPGATSDQGAERIEINLEIPAFRASSAADFSRWAESYRYDSAPLDARIEEVQETPDWRREKITFAGTDGERAIAYLYLPRHFTDPLQVINFVPAGDVDQGFRSLPASMEDRVGEFVKAGRAVFGVVLKGYIERLRPAGYVRPDRRTVEYLEEIVGRVTDIRRGLDYLATRTDLDTTRIAFFGPSSGAQLGLVLAAVETRYRAVVLIGAGLSASAQEVIAEANPINFAAHIGGPKLMLHGLYDEDTPFKTRGQPLYDLLSGPKRLVTFEGGHVPSVEQQFSEVSPFLDGVLGPVRR